MSATPNPFPGTVPRFERTPMVPGPSKIRGRVFITKERCKGCELCIEFCPVHVLARSPDFSPKGYYYPVVRDDGCVNCRLCVTICPEYAIFSRPVTRRVAAAMGLGGQA